MDEYIKREDAMLMHEPPKAHRYYQTDNLDDAYGQGWDDALCCLEHIPAADVAPVVHGHWIEYQTSYIICCSYCDWGIGPDEKTKYCPNCGAKMDGGADHEAD